ncbi:MAG: hypothetical protein J6O73_05435 [Lachnospiraceae bacterium]|nr:hypothetical protein [Lachnospiraceae bacterium]
MEHNKYVLAMYDIRGKQEFIFRTNKLKEIAGGSAVIRDLYKDYLYPASGKLDMEIIGFFITRMLAAIS